MDLSAVLAGNPGGLIDELAHTNVPGSRNPKRYEDVQDILAEGIHVITTLNIQHLESLYDIVEKATHVKIRERIPDTVLGEADQLVNVDLTTEISASACWRKGLSAGTDPDSAGELLQGGESGETPGIDSPGARLADRPAPTGDPGEDAVAARTRSWCA